MKKFLFFFLLTVFAACTSVVLGQSQIQSGTFSANSGSKDFTLDKNSGDRSYTIEVHFTKSFDKTPDVVLSVNMLDSDTKSDVRYNVKPTFVTKDGFIITISTWSSTKIFGISGNWLAYSK